MELSCPREKTYLVRSLHSDVREPTLEFCAKNIFDIFIKLYLQVRAGRFTDIGISTAFPALRDS